MKPPKRLFKNRLDDPHGSPGGNVGRMIRSIRASGQTFREIIRKVTAMVAAVEQGCHGYGPGPLKAAVVADLNQAFLSDDSWIETMNVKDHGPTEMISQAGIFRAVFLAFGHDRGDQMFQESTLRIVQETMDELIAKGAGSEGKQPWQS